MEKKGKWLEEEIQFLIENYPKYGALFCEDRLKRNKNSVRKKVRSLNLRVECKSSHYLEENFIETVNKSKSYTDVARLIGISTSCGNRATIKKYIEKYSLDISHFDFGHSNMFGRISKKLELNEILVKDSTYNHTTNLKNRLYNEGLKKRECELDGCGQGEIWRGKKISLILDHINGSHSDNRIENLRIVCPNCNAGLGTHGGKNIKNKINIERESTEWYNRKVLCECGEKKSARAKSCKLCSNKKLQKTERPTYEQLMLDIEEIGYCGAGRKYEVSDNTIRKWKKKYENNY